MSTVLLDRIPLPNFKIYTTISVLFVSACVYYAIGVTSDPYWRLQNNSTTNSDDLSTGLLENTIIGADGLLKAAVEGLNKLESRVLIKNRILSDGVQEEQNEDGEFLNDSRSFTGQIKDVIAFMSQEPICIWNLINMAYVCLILLGKSIQKVVFGELRISENQHMKDKFWNFIFYKFIFVFGVVNVQFLHEVVLWVSWFSVLGFLHILAQLCKDRFEYLSFSPTTPGWSHFRLVALLSSILTLSGIMFCICIGVGLVGGINTFAFMAAECVLLSIRTSHVLIRYGMFLYDMRHGGISNEAVSWDKRGPVAYYIELGFEVAALIVDLVHHLHMLLWSNIFLSMASLVIVMQLRYLIHEIQRKIKKHRNYLWVLNHMEKSYPLATEDDLTLNSDNCAICWEKMETARKLPCAHLFHNSCLQSWLEQDTSCPTCRLGLSVQNISTNVNNQTDRIIEDPENAGRANNHFFQFNGSRYVSWLPSFSVEVTHINNVLRNDPVPQQNAAHTSQLRNMARQVQQMFPRYPISVIITDLQASHSMEITIDNILEGRLQVPVRFQEDDFSDSENHNNEVAGSSSSGGDGGGGFAASSASDYYINPDLQYSNVTSSDSSSSSISERIEDNSLDLGYEVERSSNIFGNQNDLLKDDSLEETGLGDRFSKSSEEREKILLRRKDTLLAIARRRYLDRNKSELNQQTTRSRSKTSMQEY